MFENPQFVFAIPLALFLFGLLYVQSRRHRRRRVSQLSAIYEIPEKALNNHSVTRSRIKVLLTVLGISTLMLALARPQFGFQWIDLRKSKNQVIILLDVSRSMLVEDVYPNRLERSKLVIREIVERHPGTEMGLLVFAGNAFLQCPITGDHAALLEALETQGPEVMQQQGSDIARALMMLPDLVQHPERDRVILISDGEDHSTRLQLALQFLRDREIKVNTICIGTPKGGLIPNNQGNASEPYFFDNRGNVVFSRANPELLQRIASQLRGDSLHFQSENYSIRHLDNWLFPQAEQPSDAEIEERRIPVDYYQVPLLAAFLLLCLEFSIGTRRNENTASASRSH
ncbi:MAG: VWA domain-containing protein [Puniceicoccaceae bacterium]